MKFYEYYKDIIKSTIIKKKNNEKFSEWQLKKCKYMKYRSNLERKPKLPNTRIHAHYPREKFRIVRETYSSRVGTNFSIPSQQNLCLMRSFSCRGPFRYSWKWSFLSRADEIQPWKFRRQVAAPPFSQNYHNESIYS